MDQGLDPRLSLDHDRDAMALIGSVRARRRARSRRPRPLLQRLGLLDHREGCSPWRQELDAGHELDRRAWRPTWSARQRHRADSSPRVVVCGAETRGAEGERGDFLPDGPDVFRRGAAAPPTNRAPALMSRSRSSPCIRGWRGRSSGHPPPAAARRWAARTGGVGYGAIRSMASSITAGPTEQLRPITSTPISVSVLAIVSTSVP